MKAEYYLYACKYEIKDTHTHVQLSLIQSHNKYDVSHTITLLVESCNHSRKYDSNIIQRKILD